MGGGCGPRETGKQVRREIGQGELGHFTMVLLGWSRDLKIFLVFYFFVSLALFSSWTYSES